MKLLPAVLALLLPLSSMAQDEENAFRPASPESEAYHYYRIKTTTPPYGLAKVQALIKKTAAEESDRDAVVLNSKDYLSLSLREQFTYNMINGEAYSQNCDVEPPIQDEHKKIAAQIPDLYGEMNWSSRQLDYLNSNRDSVMAIIQESANRSKRLGVNYKMALVEIKAVEMIPFLVDFYKRDYRDKDILTVLMLLMEKQKYDPFIKSQSHIKLYGPNSNYNSYLNYNKANEDLIIQRATAMIAAAG